jgi:hypothetical protein
MAKNDTVLLDGIIQQRIAETLPSNRQDEVFEYFGLEQVLKDYDLSREEIESGWVDGRDDGGIDGFFTFVNGHLLRDPVNFTWPKRSAEIHVWVLTCKHHETFQQAPLNSIHTSIFELFDLSLDKKGLKGSYSEEVLRARSLFHVAYHRLAADRPTLSIRYAYVSRGDSAAVGENVRARASQVVELTRSLFSSCESRCDFVGAAELVLMYRRTKRFSIPLPVLEYLSRGQSGYVVLARLEDYSRFVTDDNGNLRRYLFDSNVRDYLVTSRVNEDIRESLADPAAPDFWWLNNGITILATGATVVGKTIHLEDIQIVNGLQTTETLFRYYQSAPRAWGGERSLLVKIVVSTESTHRDRIIRATNNQNAIETAGLRATDKVQRDIEEYLDRHGWYYERRKNYYRNIGKPPARFVTPMYLAAGYVALVMKNPRAAARLKSRFMRRDETYKAVFPGSAPLHAWVVITEVLKATEQVLDSVRPAWGGGERFMATWRNLVGFLAVSKTLGRFSYGTADFINLDTGAIAPSTISDMWSVVCTEARSPYRSIVSLAKQASFVAACVRRAAQMFGIADAQALNREDLKGAAVSRDRGRASTVATMNKPTLDDSFLDRVDAELPPQPWKPGIHRIVARRLGCAKRYVSAAISALVEKGRRNAQRDGVVYGSDGGVIATDPDRVPPADGTADGG